MKNYGIKVPEFGVAETPVEAERIARDLATKDLIVKAQILAGGRGKGTFQSGLQGGVHKCRTPEEVKAIAEKMLGQTLVTKQTGSGGIKVNKIQIAKCEQVKREAYFAILLDRTHQGPVMVASSEGGVDIEAVAASKPHAIIKEPFDIVNGPTDEQTFRIAKELKFPEASIPKVQQQIQNMFKMFKEKDVLVLEINPFVETSTGEVMCIDAKVNFDDNAMFRQKDVFAMRDQSETDWREVKAAEFDLNYIALDGNIGCLVNGAGLAMATMDVIKMYGGEPANFLDVGGGATRQQVLEAVKLLQSDPKVEAILINIFGGIMQCDIVAEGLVAAAKESQLTIPLVVRLEGTNVDKAKEIIKNSGLKMETAEDLDEAAHKAVKALKKE